MTLVDLNLLIYTVNSDCPQHRRARAWWERCLAGGTSIGLSWAVVLGFVRLTTNPRIFPHALSPEQAFAIVDDWLAHPGVRTVEATPRHWDIFKELLNPLGAAGNLTSDAHLAALAIEHGATLCSTDNDFARFPGLRWSNPIKAA